MRGNTQEVGDTTPAYSHMVVTRAVAGQRNSKEECEEVYG